MHVQVRDMAVRHKILPICIGRGKKLVKEFVQNPHDVLFPLLKIPEYREGGEHFVMATLGTCYFC